MSVDQLAADGTVQRKVLHQLIEQDLALGDGQNAGVHMILEVLG